MIAELLEVGRENVKTAAWLSDRLGVNRRTVYAHISQERANGSMIIGCNDGFYLARDRSDLEAFAIRSKSRALNYIKAGTPARRELKKTDGQSTLFSAKKTPADCPTSDHR